MHVPADRAVFTGDILFIEGHPILWEGPVANWITACDAIVAMDAESIVPGHGPLTDAAGVTALRDYFVYIEAEARNGEVWICDATLARLGPLAQVDQEREVDGRPVHRLLGVGGEWLMSLRGVPHPEQ